MRVTTRSPNTAVMMRRPIKRPAPRRDKTAPVYTLFYSAAGIAIALLIYASFVFSRSPPELAGSTEKPRPVAMIRLNQTDGKGAAGRWRSTTSPAASRKPERVPAPI